MKIELPNKKLLIKVIGLAGAILILLLLIFYHPEKKYTPDLDVTSLEKKSFAESSKGKKKNFQETSSEIQNEENNENAKFSIKSNPNYSSIIEESINEPKDKIINSAINAYKLNENKKPFKTVDPLVKIELDTEDKSKTNDVENSNCEKISSVKSISLVDDIGKLKNNDTSATWTAKNNSSNSIVIYIIQDKLDIGAIYLPDNSTIDIRIPAYRLGFRVIKGMNDCVELNSKNFVSSKMPQEKKLKKSKDSNESKNFYENGKFLTTVTDLSKSISVKTTTIENESE